MTRDTWHVTRDTVWFLWYFEDLEETADWLTDSINNEGVCRTAPATPGLLNTICSNYSLLSFVFMVALYVNKIYLKFINRPGVAGASL